MPSRRRLAFVAIIVAAAVATVLFATKKSTPLSIKMASGKSAPVPHVEPLLGERIMEHYADPARPAEEDLTLIAHTLDNFALLVKGSDPLPLGANEEIASALRGKNKTNLRVLADNDHAFNAHGQLVDRWGTPLFFHASSRVQIEIRSAGPDKQMWTADDIHRRHDGRFLHGEALLAPSLFEATARARPD